VTLVVQSKDSLDPAAEWADAGMDWTLAPEQQMQVFRLRIVAVDEATAALAPTESKLSAQERALQALHAAMEQRAS
jgi:hypothetical protein